MIYFVYILESQVDLSKYTGQTQNLEDRLKRHNSGKVKSTASKRPWSLYAHKIVNSRIESLKLEKKIKNLKSKTRLNKFLIVNNFIIEER